jgi:hypothetical protein
MCLSVSYLTALGQKVLRSGIYLDLVRVSCSNLICFAAEITVLVSVRFADCESALRRIIIDGYVVLEGRRLHKVSSSLTPLIFWAEGLSFPD